jgi:hypothetical protein
MATLEQLIRRASRASRGPTRARAAALWPMPEDPDVLADMIQTGRFPDAARTCEERCQAVHDARSQAIWNYLALDRTAGPLPWCAAMPMIFDSTHMIPGHADSDWHTPHPLIDYYPSPAGGIQHGVSFVGGRF